MRQTSRERTKQAKEKGIVLVVTPIMVPARTLCTHTCTQAHPRTHAPTPPTHKHKQRAEGQRERVLLERFRVLCAPSGNLCTNALSHYDCLSSMLQVSSTRTDT